MRYCSRFLELIPVLSCIPGPIMVHLAFLELAWQHLFNWVLCRQPVLPYKRIKKLIYLGSSAAESQLKQLVASSRAGPLFPILFLYTYKDQYLHQHKSVSTNRKEVTLIYIKTKAAQNVLDTSTKLNPSLGLKAMHRLHPLPPSAHHQPLYTPACTGVMPCGVISQLLTLARQMLRARFTYKKCGCWHPKLIIKTPFRI